MRRFSAARAIYLSFFSQDLYRDVAREWRGAGLAYLLLVTVLAALPFLVGIQVGMSRFVRNEAPAVLRQIPAISIRLGRVSTRVPMPYRIRARSGEVVGIIDTTGQTPSLDSTRAVLLLTSNRLIVRRPGVETRMYDLSRVGHFDLDEQRATHWVRLFATWFVLACAPLVLAGSYLVRLFQLLLFAGIAAVLAASLRLRFRFAALMRLTAVALTPMLAIDAVRGALFAQLPGWWLWSSLVVIVCLLVAMKANQQPEAPEAPAPEARPLG